MKPNVLILLFLAVVTMLFVGAAQPLKPIVGRFQISGDWMVDTINGKVYRVDHVYQQQVNDARWKRSELYRKLKEKDKESD